MRRRRGQRDEWECWAGNRKQSANVCTDFLQTGLKEVSAKKSSWMMVVGDAGMPRTLWERGMGACLLGLLLVIGAFFRCANFSQTESEQIRSTPKMNHTAG